MTIREVYFVFPKLNTLAQGRGLKQVGGGRKALITGLADKFQPVMDALNAKQDELLQQFGKPVGNTGRFRVNAQTPAHNAYKTAMRQYRNTDVPDLTLTQKEQDLVDLLILFALLDDQEDFQDI